MRVEQEHAILCCYYAMRIISKKQTSILIFVLSNISTKHACFLSLLQAYISGTQFQSCAPDMLDIDQNYSKIHAGKSIGEYSSFIVTLGKGYACQIGTASCLRRIDCETLYQQCHSVFLKPQNLANIFSTVSIPSKKTRYDYYCKGLQQSLAPQIGVSSFCSIQ